MTPTAYAKLLCLRDAGETEVGGFGISSPDDLLLIEDIRLVRQECTPVTVKFADLSVADFYDEQVDQGRRPEEFGRVWIHTHPGNSALPSSTDEQTFARCFGKADWAIMFILAQEGQTYCRLRFNVGPGGSLEIPFLVDYTRPFPGSDHAAWHEEYRSNVTVDSWPTLRHDLPLFSRMPPATTNSGNERQAEFLDTWDEYLAAHDTAWDLDEEQRLWDEWQAWQEAKTSDVS